MPFMHPTPQHQVGFVSYRDNDGRPAKMAKGHNVFHAGEDVLRPVADFLQVHGVQYGDADAIPLSRLRGGHS